jgi:alpha/beta superfamily hydrolase
MITEHPVTVDVSANVSLEASVALPAGAGAGVVVCHPHPLYGGDMDNPIVLTVRDACHRAGVATLRFNFRGTGRSTGRHDNGNGERDDVRAALAALGKRLPANGAVALAGYSFGAATASAVAAAGEPLAGLALIAPPLAAAANRSAAPPHGVGGPILVVSGDRDEYCPATELQSFRTRWPAADVRMVHGADHFFGGYSSPLLEILVGWAGAVASRRL